MKIIKILEIAWLVISIVAFSIATYMLIGGSTKDAVFFYIFTAVAIVMYLVRKKQRTKMQKDSEINSGKE